MDPARLRRATLGPVGESQRLVAAVLAAARQDLGLDLSYGLEIDASSNARSVPVEGADGRLFGILSAPEPLSDADRRAVKTLASVIASRLARDEWVEEDLRTQVGRVRRLLMDESIAIALQPIFDLEGGQVVGVEALARFPSAPSVSPEIWFAEAEAARLGPQLERAAARAALKQLGRLSDHVFLSINASPALAVDRCLRESMRGQPHDRIVLEVTEHAPVDDYDDFERRLSRRRGEGVRLAVDDAGAGFASLRHVLRLRPEIIKLDISLVRGIDHDVLRQSLAGSVVAFAQALGADVLAEGIETPAELRQVRSLGIKLGQGFLLGRPELAGPTHEVAVRSAG